MSLTQDKPEAPVQGQKRVTPPPSTLVPEQTPVAKRISGSVPFSHQRSFSGDELKKLLALETSGRYIGPMPVEKFLAEFLPTASQPPSVKQDMFARMANAEPETQMYTGFIDCMKSVVPMEFVDTHKTEAQVDEFVLKPDVSVYMQDGPKNTEKSDFLTMETWVEFKAKATDDPFDDPDESVKGQVKGKAVCFEKDGAQAEQTRGQLTAYAVAHLGSQFRHHAFSVLIMGNVARLMRWDRAGVVISRRFNYIQHPGLMTGFFWRLSHLEPKQRGIDTSVTPVPDSPDLSHVRKALLLDSSTPLFEFKVPDGEGTRSYYGPRPYCPSFSLIGRSTRALPVYDVVNKKRVYLKDTWRINEPQIQLEGKVYERLKQARVPGIAPFECGGDVGHTTITQNLVLEDWSYVREPITGHVHYRMVLGVVGRKLAEFKSTKELVQGALGALIAHSKAYSEAKILHRDVSPGNIILTDDGQGLLIDWDMSKPLEVKNRRRRDRTGTWQFMSAALLQNPDKEHEVKDDLESFLHVLTWCTVRYVPNILDPEERRHYLAMFDESTSFTHKVVGGDLKAKGLGATNTYLIDFKLEQPSPLISLLRQLSRVFAPLYSVPFEEGELDPFETEESSKVERDRFQRRHQQSVQWLSNSQWFITTFESCLGSPGWPGNDGSVSNPVAPPATLTHRQLRLEMDRIMNRGTRYHVSSHHSSQGAKRARSPSAAPVDDGQGKRARED